MSRITPAQMNAQENATISELAYFEGMFRRILSATYSIRTRTEHPHTTSHDGQQIADMSTSVADHIGTMTFWLREAERNIPGHQSDWQLVWEAWATLRIGTTLVPKQLGQDALSFLGLLALVRIALEAGIERAFTEREQFVDTMIDLVQG